MKEINKIKIGIVGHGFVGKATDWGFNTQVEKFIVDPQYNTTISQLSDFSPELVFICVPTPMNDDGSQDSSIINSVVNELSIHCKDAVKVIKSTVLPSLLKLLKNIDKKIIYNPEFLREKYANEDFLNSEFIIFGGDRNISTFVSNAYLKHSRCKTTDHIFTDLETASLLKYSVNTFLATKVIFFNEINALFNSMDVADSWSSFIEVLSKDKRIGESHMEVPGHDGRKGFGGACFPKDSLAFVKYAEENNIDMSLLKKTIQTNNLIRSNYSDLVDREKEQNVSFESKL